MLIIQSIQSNVLEVWLKGTLSLQDFQQKLPKLEMLLSHWETLHLLIHLRDFDGLEPATWRQVRIEPHALKSLIKTAVVGEQKWRSWSRSLAKRLKPSRLRFFQNEKKARRWLLTEKPTYQPEGS